MACCDSFIFCVFRQQQKRSITLMVTLRWQKIKCILNVGEFFAYNANLQLFTVLHQSEHWSRGIKRETTQTWCANRYIILCMYYLHSMYSSHCSPPYLASRGFTTPLESKPEAGHKLKPSCPLNTNQAVWLIGMGNTACSVSQWRVRRSVLSLWVHNSIHDSLPN